MSKRDCQLLRAPGLIALKQIELLFDATLDQLSINLTQVALNLTTFTMSSCLRRISFFKRSSMPTSPVRISSLALAEKPSDAETVLTYHCERRRSVRKKIIRRAPMCATRHQRRTDNDISAL
jgi:hypothetical protein